MRAWICEKWGDPEDLVLASMPERDCPADKVRIKVEAWGVNFADLVLIAGKYQARPPFPFIPGMEVAGIVEDVGTAVHHLEPGDRVAAYVEYGGYAELVTAPAPNVARLPETTPWVDAAAFPVPYATAALALERGQLKPGETALVGGAGGAVGSAITELAHGLGATVIACASSEEKMAVARDCGADFIISSQSDTLREDVQSAAPEGVDVVFDPIGGEFFEKAFRTMTYGGRIVTLGFASGQFPSARVNQVLARHLSVVGSSLGLTCHRDPAKVAAMWPPLVEKLSRGEIRPKVSEVMPFEDLPRAMRKLADRDVSGRLVLKS